MPKENAVFVLPNGSLLHLCVQGAEKGEDGRLQADLVALEQLFNAHYLYSEPLTN